MGLNYQKLFGGDGSLYVGAAGLRPSLVTPFGATSEDGVSIADVATTTPIQPYLEPPFASVRTAPGATITFTIQEFDMAVLQKALSDMDRSGSVAEAGSAREQYASMVIRKEARANADVDVLEFFFPWVAQTGGVTLQLSNMVLGSPLEFTAMKQDSTPPWRAFYKIKNQAIASDTFAKAADINGYRLAGEGDAADDLSSVTGGTAGDKLVLVAADGAIDITLKDDLGATGIVADEFIMTGSADLILAELGDIAVFVCTLIGAGPDVHWVESWHDLASEH